jgi:hypothetical protein
MRTRKEKRADTRGRKIGPSYPKWAVGSQTPATSSPCQARPTIEQLFWTDALVTASVTKPYSPGDGGTLQGERPAEVTESLIDYTTFVSLRKRLNEVSLKVNKNLIAIDTPHNSYELKHET